MEKRESKKYKKRHRLIERETGRVFGLLIT